MNGKGNIEPVRSFLKKLLLHIIWIVERLSVNVLFCDWIFLVFLYQKAAIAGKAGGGSWKERAYLSIRYCLLYGCHWHFCTYYGFTWIILAQWTVAFDKILLYSCINLLWCILGRSSILTNVSLSGFHHYLYFPAWTPMQQLSLLDR